MLRRMLRGSPRIRARTIDCCQSPSASTSRARDRRHLFGGARRFRLTMQTTTVLLRMPVARTAKAETGPSLSRAFWPISGASTAYTGTFGSGWRIAGTTATSGTQGMVPPGLPAIAASASIVAGRGITPRTRFARQGASGIPLSTGALVSGSALHGRCHADTVQAAARVTAPDAEVAASGRRREGRTTDVQAY